MRAFGPVSERTHPLADNPLIAVNAGESAGGNSVMNHLAQPDSFPGLYNKAIIESGVYNAGAGTMADAQKAYSASLAIMGCPDIACLVDKDADEVATKLIGKAGEGPVVDGVSLTDTPLGLIGAKKYNNKVRHCSALLTVCRHCCPSPC
jgi:carboxylesterase type B|eukprot:COSAG02_NODE_3953_length_5991_cov_2.270367_2_plen_149_part_00